MADFVGKVASAVAAAHCIAQVAVSAGRRAPWFGVGADCTVVVAHSFDVAAACN